MAQDGGHHVQHGRHPTHRHLQNGPVMINKTRIMLLSFYAWESGGRSSWSMGPSVRMYAWKKARDETMNRGYRRQKARAGMGNNPKGSSTFTLFSFSFITHRLAMHHRLLSPPLDPRTQPRQLARGCWQQQPRPPPARQPAPVPKDSFRPL